MTDQWKWNNCVIMKEKFQNKYRIPSARLQKWDYQWAAAYFITVCTKTVIFSGKINMKS